MVNVIFLFAIRLTFVILQGANIYKFKKIIHKFFIISFALTWNDIHLFPRKGNNSILEKCQKLKILESNRKLANDLLLMLCDKCVPEILWKQISDQQEINKFGCFTASCNYKL